MEFDQVIDVLNSPGGVIALFTFIFWTGYRGVWVWGKLLRDTVAEWRERYEAMRTEKDEWKAAALASTSLAEQMVGAVGERRR